MEKNKLSVYINKIIEGVIDGSQWDGYVIRTSTDENGKDVIYVNVNLDVDNIMYGSSSNNNISFSLEIRKK
jgi:hypothetical protein